MEIVANKKNENQLQVPVLQYSCIVDFLTSVISTQVFFPEKWRTKQSLKWHFKGWETSAAQL